MTAVGEVRAMLMDALRSVPGLTVTPHPHTNVSAPCAWLQDGADLVAVHSLGQWTVGLDVHIAVAALDRDAAIAASDELLQQVVEALPAVCRWGPVGPRSYERDADVIRTVIPTTTPWRT